MTNPLAKADGALRSLLAGDACTEVTVAAILELDAPPWSAARSPLGGTIEATQRRSAARENAAEALAHHTAGTRAELERLGLAPRGGRHVPFVTVRGPADVIRAALNLTGVVSAALDA